MRLMRVIGTVWVGAVVTAAAAPAAAASPVPPPTPVSAPAPAPAAERASGPAAERADVIAQVRTPVGDSDEHRPTENYGGIPLVTVYADGRVITRVNHQMAGWYPLFPDLRERQVSPRDARRLARSLRRALDADLGDPEPRPFATRFTATTGGTVRTVAVDDFDDVYSRYPRTHGLTATQQDNQAHLRAVVAQLFDLPGTLGARAVGPDHPYRPAAVAAINIRQDVAKDYYENRPLVSALVTYRGAPLPGRPIGHSAYSCALTTGPDVATMVTEGTNDTIWRGGGGRYYQIEFRPLLPHESTCGAILS
ncbi:hypothetical protein [Cryptosporangium sp. NPDC051539]|uniref:hypothetical protein n=1 Tax=Cryptosporangium sp. NPDC051539 TaxID=3363962 RepID=UPI00379ACB7E